MEQVVSITRQGQLTIPKFLRDGFGIQGGARAIVRREGDTIVVKPQGSFWKLGGSLTSAVKLSDTQLRKARHAFGTRWAHKK